MMENYTPKNWFWIVSGDTSRAWSTADGAYVATWDANRAFNVADEVQLSDILRNHGLKPIIPGASDVRTEASRRMQVAFGARDAAHLEIIISNAVREVARLNQIKVGVPHPAGGWLVEPREWTGAERQRLAELHAADQLLEAIRAASNAMEAAPPLDYAADNHWP